MGGKYKGGQKAILKSRLRTAPCVGIEAPGEEKKRDRVLIDAEIDALWAACGKGEPDGSGGIGKPFGSFTKMLLLTGQRRAEVAEMRWSEIDKDKCLWTIPGGRTKNKLVHIVPLSTQAMAIIDSVTRIAGDFVFTTTGDSGLGGFSRAKERINKRMKAAKPWTFHDLRRTASTGMSSLGVQPHVVEAVINHISGSKAGVAGTYNRWAYLPEKTDALQLWADHLDRLVAGNPAKVIPIRSRRS
jgi:integrase